MMEELSVDLVGPDGWMYMDWAGAGECCGFLGLARRALGLMESGFGCDFGNNDVLG